MREATRFRVPKWPFFLGDACMLGLAYFIYWQGSGPVTHWDVTAICICVGLGAVLSVTPFLLDYKALLRLMQMGTLGTVSEKISGLERVAAQIGDATSQWETAQLQAEKTANSANAMADRMATEVRDFNEFMQKMNEGEKAALRLETEKLRRVEGEWLQVVVRMLDHVFALHAAAVRSGKTGVIEQLTHFQNACQDAARRVGLVPFVAAAGEPFDSQRHQWADGDTVAADAVVTETLASGYTFQGRQVRHALVRVQQKEAAEPKQTEPASAGESEQNQLPLTPT